MVHGSFSGSSHSIVSAMSFRNLSILITLMSRIWKEGIQLKANTNLTDVSSAADSRRLFPVSSRISNMFNNNMEGGPLSFS